MTNLLKMALRNLFRYKRRTLLTMALIVSGLVFVLLFVAVTGSFKNMMVGQITDSFLGQIQIHRGRASEVQTGHIGHVAIAGEEDLRGLRAFA